MTKDEIVEYATTCAQILCREYKVDEQDVQDYVQEGVLHALDRASRRPGVNKGFISQVVKGAVTNYHNIQRNGGIGGHDAGSYDYVSLAEPVNGAVDDDGEPLTHGDLLVYQDPPEGYGDPADEWSSVEDAARLQRAIKALPADDQQFLQIAAFSELTQSAAAKRLGVSQPAVQARLGRLLVKLHSILQ